MIRDLVPYPAYRESNADWFGSVPEHWDVRTLKRVARLEYGDSLPSDTRADGQVPVFGSNGRVGWHAIANTTAPCLVVGRKGSFGKISFSWVPVFAIDTTFHIDGHSLRDDMRWLFYVLGCLKLDQVSKDSAVPGLDREDAYQQVVPVPPLAEQVVIARVLDHADRRIQHYIRAKRKLIALLNEQKQAIIHQAVTRGLDPNVRLKPSGVEWLGDVPEHWEVKRLRTLMRRIDQGVSPQAEAALADDCTWGVLKAGCVNGGVFRDTEHKRLPVAFRVDEFLAVAAGDILVSRASGSARFVGSTARVERVNYRLILSDKTFRLVPLDGRLADFVVWAMNARYFRMQIEEAISGAEGLANNLPLSSLKDFRIAVPPAGEAQAVAADLRHRILGIGVLIERARREIDLLHEYRTRLISDVVTGKLDVREAAAKLPDDAEDMGPLDDMDETPEEIEDLDVGASLEEVAS